MLLWYWAITATTVRKMKKFLSLIFGIFGSIVVTSSLFAGVPDVSSTRPALKGVEKIYMTSKMSNGLELITMESHKVPLITLVLAVKGGASTESPDTNGLSHFWEHMFFKGNKRLPTQELFKKRVRQLGIFYNGDTSAELIRYYFTMPSSLLEEGLQFMADAISEPLLDEKEVERERGVILDEYDRNASNPQFDFWKLNQGLMFGSLMYLRDPLGRRHVIEQASRSQLLDMKNRIFVPANSALLVVGDVDPVRLPTLAQKYFGAWRTPEGWAGIVPPEIPSLKKSTEFVMTRKDVRNASVFCLFRGPRARSQPEDSFAADVLINLLQHQSGKFFKKFVDSGLTFGAELNYLTQSHAGQLNLFAVTEPQKVRSVKKLLLSEIEEWAKPGYFSKEHLEDIRRNLLIDHKFQLNKPSSYAKTLAFWWGVTGFDYYDSYLDHLRRVQLTDVQRFVRNYFIQKPSIVSILLSPEGAKEAGLVDNSQPLLESVLADYYEKTKK